MAGLQRGQRASGDLIPWTMAQQFQDDNFPQLSGARIVRIATHPEYQKMGYGSRALHLLKEYYEGKIVSIEEDIEAETIDEVQEEELGLLQETLAPRKNLPPLLQKLSERPPEPLHYIGTSYGLTAQLLKFWKKSGFVPTYVRQTKNDLTGEHTVIMLRTLDTGSSSSWLPEFWTDFRHRLVNLLGYQLSSLPPSLALSLLHNKSVQESSPGVRLSSQLLTGHVTLYDIKRLELYSNNMADHHLITDLLPSIAKLIMTKQLGDVHLSAVQLALLVGLGLQHKTVDDLSVELELPSSQLLGLFNRSIRKISGVLREILEGGIEEHLNKVETTKIAKKKESLPSLGEELTEGAEEVDQQQKQLMNEKLSEYVVQGSEEEWSRSVGGGKTLGMVSIKVGEKRQADDNRDAAEKKHKKKKSNKENHKKSHKKKA